MPDSSTSFEDSASQRSVEILESCMAVFAQKGFDGATMQDLARAAGMSASNFYRYFPSKDAIVVALVERKVADIEARFLPLRDSTQLRPMLLKTMAEYLSDEGDANEGQLWAEMQAAALRRPAVGEALQRMEDSISRHVLQLFARLSGLPEAEAEQKFRAHAAMIFLLSRGALMGRCGLQPLTPVPPEDLLGLVIRATDQILEDVSSSR